MLHCTRKSLWNTRLLPRAELNACKLVRVASGTVLEQRRLYAQMAGKPLTPRQSDILNYWLTDPMNPVPNYGLWFGGTQAIDADIRSRFGGEVEAAASGQLDSWAAEGQLQCLALIIVMDQFALNVFRDDPRSFMTSAASIAHAKHAIGQGWDKTLPFLSRQWLYLPMMHSESKEDQIEQVRLYESSLPDSEGVMGFAIEHRDIVLKYGRFPGRNGVMQRISTPDELDYLKNGGIF